MKDEAELRREILAKLEPCMRKNAIHIIVPYQWNGLWVFDDEGTGLVREPFIAGADTVLDRATENMPGAKHGCMCMFSAAPFPKATLELTWRKGTGVPSRDGEDTFRDWGNVYWCEEFKIEAWLCPALFLYFDKAPPKIYAAILPLNPTKKP